MRTFRIGRVLNRFFGKNLDLQVQVYNLLAFVGIISGISVAVIAFLLKEHIVTVLINLAVSLVSFILLCFAEKKKYYHACSWAFIALIFFVFFPVLFFACGGTKSGVGFSFMIAFVFSALLLDGYERLAALILEFLIYFTCFIVAYYIPQALTSLPTEYDYHVVTLVNFSLSSAIILTVLLIRTRMFHSRHKQIAELNRELSARNETLALYDKMKSNFLATVAKEVDTPLAIISASSDAALYLLQEEPIKKDEIKGDLQAIKQRVKLIGSILLDLMDTAAIENGRISLNRQLLSLSVLITRICDAQFRQLDSNDNEIIYSLQPDLPSVWADPARFEQVMVNLLSNAVRHTKTGTIEVKLERSDNRQIVSVKDNGEGMDAETARLALRQYVSTKSDYWRHGIGLYTCRRIVVAHGGDIWIESKKGQGATVSFTIAEGAAYE